MGIEILNNLAYRNLRGEILELHIYFSANREILRVIDRKAQIVAYKLGRRLHSLYFDLFRIFPEVKGA